MTIFVFCAILGAALMHATWNALIKTSGAKLNGMLIMTGVQGCVGGVVALTRDLPQGEVWFWLIGSGILHSAYKLFLSYAYEQGDLSRVYPIARGAAPMMVMVAGTFLLNDIVRSRDYLAICILGMGIALMARGAFFNGESRRLVPLAFGSAIATAAYSMVDGVGARIMGDAAGFVAWMFVFDAVIFSSVAVVVRGRNVLISPPRAWGMGALAAIASYISYGVAVWAMTQAPIALVTALREASILLAVLIGWLIFNEKMDRAKAAASALIVLGVVVTRF